MRNVERAEIVAELREAGYTYAEIGDILGISRQSARYALHPQGRVSAERAAELEQLRAGWRAKREAAAADTLDP